MNKIWQKIIIGLCLVSSVLVLALSIRGNPGNPGISELESPEWKVNGPFELSPERGRFALLYSIVEENSLNFSLPLARFITPDLGYINGKYVSLFAPAVSYLSVPGYLIGRYFGASQFGSYATSAVFALGNCVLIYLISKRFGVSKIAGIIAGFIFIFATPSYAYAVNLYQHHFSTFIILFASYLAINFTSWLSLAFIWFLALTSLSIDYPNLVLLVPVALYCLPQLINISLTKTLKVKINFIKWLSIIGAVIPLLFFFWFNNASYGNPFQFSGTVQSVSKIDENGMPAMDLSQAEDNIEAIINSERQENKTALGFFDTRDLLNGLYILLLSEDRGLIFFTPILLFGLIGMHILYHQKPKETVLLISIIIANILLYGMWGDPWGGWAFGARYLIPSYAILAIFVSVALSHKIRNLLFFLGFLLVASYSLYVNSSGALTSSANPPKVQVLKLEKITSKQEKYTYARNIDLLSLNESKSFVFRVLAKKYMTAWEYFNTIYLTLFSILFILMSILFLTIKRQKT